MDHYPFDRQQVVIPIDEARYSADRLIFEPDTRESFLTPDIQDRLDKAGVDIPLLRRNLQREHVRRIAHVLTVGNGTPADARALQRMNARTLVTKLKAAEARPGLSKEARAHLADSPVDRVHAHIRRHGQRKEYGALLRITRQHEGSIGSDREEIARHRAARRVTRRIPSCIGDGIAGRRSELRRQRRLPATSGERHNPSQQTRGYQ